MPPVRYTTVGAVVLAFVIAAVAVRVAQAIVHRALNTLDIVGSENRTAVHERARQLIRALTLLAYGVAALGAISLALNRFGVNEPAWNPRLLLHWLLTHGVNVVIILVGAFIVVRAANLAIEHLRFKLARRRATTDLEWQRRAATLGGILTSLVTATVAFVAILMLLRELTIDVLPILTGAGIAGLAIGFGAQSLVKDTLSGLFMIVEDQYGVGDVIDTGTIVGTVEEVTLRITRMRDGDGVVWYVRNGEILRLGNRSQGWSVAIVDVQLAYTDDIARVTGIMTAAIADLADQDEWSDVLMETPHVTGIEAMTQGLVTLRVTAQVRANERDGVQREIRSRLKTAFDANDVHMPVPFTGPVG